MILLVKEKYQKILPMPVATARISTVIKRSLTCRAACAFTSSEDGFLMFTANPPSKWYHTISQTGLPAPDPLSPFKLCAANAAPERITSDADKNKKASRCQKQQNQQYRSQMNHFPCKRSDMKAPAQGLALAQH